MYMKLTLASRIRESWHIVALATVVVVAAMAILAAFFWPITDLIAAHDVGKITGSARAGQLQLARDAARGRLIQLGSGLFFAAALVFTARGYMLSRRTFELTEQGQVTARYTQAIEQLGSTKLDVRIGGIFSLERVAYDSVRDHPAVTEVLAAFVREHSHEGMPQESEIGQGNEMVGRTPPEDVQAAVTVIGRRKAAYDAVRLNLVGVNLRNVNLAGANLARANLARANLSGANLAEVNLDNAELSGADLTKADLSRANLKEANLDSANMADALLTEADLTNVSARTANFTNARLIATFVTGASLISANLTGADLTGASAPLANFSRTKLNRANLASADLSSANLSDADLPDANLAGANLSDADLTSALLPLSVNIPDGWARPPGSSRLARISEPFSS
jgi:uncharacterized protein YjbI with pentapeptide repeats